MALNKIKAAFVLLFGGIGGLIKYALELFNNQILAKIPNKETGLKYLKDAQAFYAFLKVIIDNHAADMSAERKKSLESVLAAIEELTKALEDFKIEETEFTGIVQKVEDAIDAFKKAKK